MPVAFQQGIEQYGVGAGGFDMRRPIQNFQNAMGLRSVIFPGGAAQAQGVDLIYHCFVKPHSFKLLF